jgi:hypothetical protein
MAGRSADQITEWEGGSLGELVSMLQAAALPVRIEVIASGAANSSVGEVHLLAGGMADAFAGSLRREDAMAALQRLEGARFVVESRLPNPETGSLSEPGPHQGNLKDRQLAALMRYCEDYVLTCRLEVWRGQDRAVISYRRGEIIGTVVGGSEASDRLPEVMAWVDGSYEIILPAPVLPQLPSSRRRETQGLACGRTPAAELRPERKRHTTLPMATPVATTTKPTTTPTAVPATGIPARPPGQPVASAPSAPATPIAPARPALAAPPLPRPPAPPAQPAKPASASRLIPPQLASTPPKPPIRPMAPAVAAQAPVPVIPKEPLDAGLTTRGTPPVPPVPLIPPRPMAQPAARATGPAAPAGQGSATTTPQARPAAPMPVKPEAPTAPAAAPPSVLPAIPPPLHSPAPAQSPPTANVRPSKPATATTTAPVASNDLKPTSGTIDAKPRHAAQHPPVVAPIEVADQPVIDAVEKIAATTVVPARTPAPRRRHVARKGLGEHPVRIYVFVGLAIGVGIVLAYWAYWYLPFGHH